jgi:hypothetical protein
MQRDERGLRVDGDGSGSTLRQLGVLLAVVFVITLAIVVGKRMSAEAMAVVVGVVCGVAASIPTSVLLLLAVSRRDRQPQDDRGHVGMERSNPPVVVIQGGGQPSLAPGAGAGYWPAALNGPSVQREFHVVGGDDLLEHGRY